MRRAPPLGEQSLHQQRVAGLLAELDALLLQKDFVEFRAPMRFCAEDSEPYRMHVEIDANIARVVNELEAIGVTVSPS